MGEADKRLALDDGNVFRQLNRDSCSISLGTSWQPLRVGIMVLLCMYRRQQAAFGHSVAPQLAVVGVRERTSRRPKRYRRALHRSGRASRQAWCSPGGRRSFRGARTALTRAATGHFLVQRSKNRVQMQPQSPAFICQGFAFTFPGTSSHWYQ